MKMMKKNPTDMKNITITIEFIKEHQGPKLKKKILKEIKKQKIILNK